jgi:hypothetical protein
MRSPYAWVATRSGMVHRSASVEHYELADEHHATNMEGRAPVTLG